MDYLRRLLAFYWRPRRAASETLDHSRLGAIALLAVATAVALQAPGFLRRQVLSKELTMLSERTMAAQARFQQKSDAEKAQAPTDPDFKELMANARRAMELYREEIKAANAPGGFRELGVIAGIFVPTAICLVVLWQGQGRCPTILRREYGSVLLCVLAGWTAARLPLIPIVWLSSWKPGLGSDWLIPVATFASTGLLIVLAAICFRTCLGARFLPAGAAAVLGGGVVTAAGMVTSAISLPLWIFASPCVAFYAWSHFSAGLNSIGSSLSGRQSLRRALEATTINPRDADAHYQIGLMQVQRRNLAEAEACFRKAVEIDQHDADYAYQLGRVLRDRGQLPEALEWFNRAARINEKTAGGEVWREIGATQLDLGRCEESLAALQRYVSDREYDPIGLVYYGEALDGSDRSGDARVYFERALEAIRTMPQHRRGELRPWAGRAKTGLRRTCSVG
jgi:Tfp pilus assembly protein PilF